MHLCLWTCTYARAANLVQLHSDGKPRRCISFGGDGRLRGPGLDIDANGLMWLSRDSALEGRAEPGGRGTPMGSSGVWRVPALVAAESIKNGETSLDDYLVVSGKRTHAHTHTRTHAHMYTCTRVHVHTCTRAHVHVYTCTRAHVHTCTRAHVHTHHARTCTRSHARTHTRSHARTHTRSHARMLARSHARTLARSLAHPTPGLVCFESEELSEMLSRGQLAVVEDAKPLWPQV